MMRAPRSDVLTVPALERIPDLVHGFGTREFDLAALRRLAALDLADGSARGQIHFGPGN